MNKRLVGSVVALLAVAILVTVTVIALKKDNGPTADSGTDEAKAGSSSQSSTSQNQTQPSDNGSNSNENSTTEPAATSEVKIEDFAFSPAVIKVKKGTTVTWTNKDSTAHTITGTDSNKGPESGMLEEGETYSFTFDEVGTFSYFCAPHPHMKGQVVVE